MGEDWYYLRISPKYNLSFAEALKGLAAIAGVSEAKPRTVAQTYNYTDEAGGLLFQVVRYEPKGFSQRRPDGKGGWIYDLKGITPILYNLPEVVKAETVFIVEGEKDVESLRQIGIVATTNPMGAGKWKAHYNPYLTGKDVVILPDNDEPGRKHAEEVAQNLKGIARKIKVVTLPGLPTKGDVTDWITKGGTKESLLQIVSKAPEWKEEDTQKALMTFTRLDNLFQEDEEKVSWIVGDMLPTGGFSLLAGKPKGGKSTLARNLALHIAQGRDFLDRKVERGAVLYLALEEKRTEVKKHFKDMGATGDEEIYIFASSAPVDALNQIREKAGELRPALIIIDPLFRLTRVKDGNDYAQVTQALEPLLRLARDTEAHVLVVHHTGKGERQGGDSILGSTAIFASVDTAIILKRGDRYRTIHTIQRYGQDLEETTLHFDSDSRTISVGKTKEEEDGAMMEKAILEYLQGQEEPLTEAETMEAVEGRTGVKRKSLRSLVKQELVSREGKGGKGDPFKYSCSLVPTIYTGTTKQENEIGCEPLTDNDYSGSGIISDYSKNVKSWEQEKLPQNGVIPFDEVQEFLTPQDTETQPKPLEDSQAFQEIITHYTKQGLPLPEAKRLARSDYEADYGTWEG